jgi:hypothetical protein
MVPSKSKKIPFAFSFITLMLLPLFCLVLIGFFFHKPFLRCIHVEIPQVILGRTSALCESYPLPYLKTEIFQILRIKAGKGQMLKRWLTKDVEFSFED